MKNKHLNTDFHFIHRVIESDVSQAFFLRLPDSQRDGQQPQQPHYYQLGQVERQELSLSLNTKTHNNYVEW